MQVKIDTARNEVCFGEHLGVSFQRTLRIPDDGKVYPLPPSLGTFPVFRIQDYRSAVPEAWKDHGGVFIPMWQREALWLRFRAPRWRSYAMKVGVGKVCALTGKPWTDQLHADEQDYVVVPEQPWLDGIKGPDGTVRQFVAMPLGMGYTVEGQVTGEETHGGLQLMAFDSRKGRFPTEAPEPLVMSSRRGGQALFSSTPSFGMPLAASCLSASPSADYVEMGLGAGGSMQQVIHQDPYGIKTWKKSGAGRVFVHIVNSQMFRDITGRPAPESPIGAAHYTQQGFPWFELYEENAQDIPSSGVLDSVKTVKEKDQEHGFIGQQDDNTVYIPGSQVVKLPGQSGWPKDPNQIKDGTW